MRLNAGVSAKRKGIAFLGAFGQGNLGNECTLQAILHHARRYFPDGEFTCICSNPADTALRHNLPASPISWRHLRKASTTDSVKSRNPLVRFLRRLLLGVPQELRDWFRVFQVVRRIHTLIVPGTGFLTDAYSNSFGWPYDAFKWSLMAKLLRRKLLYLSVGAGPIYRPLSRWLVRSALSFADYRSYRDAFTLNYVNRMGVSTQSDHVYPDLAFDMDAAVLPPAHSHTPSRPTVGIGLMNCPGRLSGETFSTATYRSYLRALAAFVHWLLIHEYDVRLLIGDFHYDAPVTHEFAQLVRAHGATRHLERLVNQPASSVEQLLSQLASNDLVVATRFHNVLLALLLNKPVMAITFHNKGVSLMDEMGLAEYCQDMQELKTEKLIQQFVALERNADKLSAMIAEKANVYRTALETQYAAIVHGHPEYWPKIEKAPSTLSKSPAGRRLAISPQPHR